jgi:hypothetical protein
MKIFKKTLPEDLKACLYSPEGNKNLLLNKNLNKAEKEKIKDEANSTYLKLKIWS